MAPSTDPDTWFLNDRGNPDSALSIYSIGNHVEPLVDGEIYMKRLHEVLTSTGDTPGDYVLFAGWELNLDQKLVDDGSDSSVATVFKAARQRGVDVRVMLSNHATNKNNKADKAFRPASKSSPASDSIECILDSRLRRAGLGSAHQKFCVILTDRGRDPARKLATKELHAFCGGIDLQTDRWDNRHHRPQPFRQFSEYPGGWHDVHTFVRGPACVDLWRTFTERWNNPVAPRPQERGPYSKFAISLPGTTTPAAGNHFVQVLRTYPCGYTELVGGPEVYELVRVEYPYARQGEFSIRDACLRAIRLAEDYIYIEDQYFYSLEIARALRDQLLAKPNLRVIVVVPMETADKHMPAANYYQARAIDLIEQALKGTPSEGHFAIYDLRCLWGGPHFLEQVYVHAKLMIVDDVWAEIGSMNCNRRSMTHDLEVAVAVVDGDKQAVTYGSYGEVCVFARQLRLSLWSEHLTVLPTDAAIQTPIDGFNEWKRLAEELTVPARVHVTGEKRWPWTAFGIWDSLVDPQGRCAGAPTIESP